MIRSLVVIGLLVSSTLTPQAAVVALAALAVLFFPRFWEAALIGLFLDMLYGVALPRWFGFQFIYTLALCAAIFVVEQLKKSMWLYRVPV